MLRHSHTPPVTGHALALAILLTLASRSLDAQRAISIRHAAAPTASVRVFGSFAELRVRGWNKDTVAISGTVPNDARFDGGFLEPKSALSPGAKFYLETASGAPNGKLELMVPAGARVWAKSGSAVIDVDGVTGGLDLNVIGGSVHVGGNPHDLTVEAMDGAVTIDGSPAWTRLKTASGDLTMSGSSEDAVLTTVSGTIHVPAGRFDRLRIESITGAVDFAGDVVPAGTIDIDTHSGAVDVRLSKKLNAEYDLAALAGTIENQITNRPPTTGREGRGQELGFTTGDGGARIYIRTFRGNIRLAAR